MKAFFSVPTLLVFVAIFIQAKGGSSRAPIVPLVEWGIPGNEEGDVKTSAKPGETTTTVNPTDTTTSLKSADTTTTLKPADTTTTVKSADTTTSAKPADTTTVAPGTAPDNCTSKTIGFYKHPMIVTNYIECKKYSSDVFGFEVKQCTPPGTKFYLSPPRCA